jgi:cellobiose phosphorylase
MQYGYFDDEQQEYVITRADTPRPWSNYLGSTEYGAIITNHAGGYSFYRSAARGRFVRLRFNSVPLDQPGRYFYVRDNESGDYWSTSWQPVGKPLDQCTYECRHGTAYTLINHAYGGIASETAYFVPLNRNFECWVLRLTNDSKRKRDLSVFTYVEFASDWTARLDQFDTQYSQYVIKSDMIDGLLNTSFLRYLDSDLKNVETQDQGRNSWFTIVGADIAGFDTRREVFVGKYRGYHNPEVVEKGECTGSLSHGDNACGTIQVVLSLAPGENREFMVLMGVGSVERWGRRTRDEFATVAKARAALEEVKRHWHDKIGAFKVSTPDKEFDSLINVWAAYNSLMTYTWSRAASLVYGGERDGLGYRDTVQDFLGATGLVPDEVRDRLELMLTGQFSCGGAATVVDPFAHKPGRMKPRGHYRSDDCLWHFNSVPEWVKESGDIGFFDKVLPYADEGEATVLGHLRRALEFNLGHLGANGIPVALGADWNDCIGLGHTGESFFVAFQVRLGLAVYGEVCRILDRGDDAAWADLRLRELDEKITAVAWDGAWWRRGIRGDGYIIGSDQREEGKIFLEPQPWAVIAGAGTRQQQTRAMDSVHERLATEYGVMLCMPPFRHDASCGAVLFNAGQKENSGIFQHPQGWVVIAEAMLGRGKRAYEYFRAYMPSAYNTRSDLREIEPYAYAQSTHGKYSRMFGKARLPWLSGTASWSYYAATHYVMGVRPEYRGLTVDPCVPPEWKEFAIQRRWRGRSFAIRVENSKGVEKGVKKIVINGEEIPGSFIPEEKMKGSNRVTVVMG